MHSGNTFVFHKFATIGLITLREELEDQVSVLSCVLENEIEMEEEEHDDFYDEYPLKDENNKEIAFTIVDIDNDGDRDIISNIEQDDCK